MGNGYIFALIDAVTKQSSFKSLKTTFTKNDSGLFYPIIY